jgi:hypothetical protein
VLFYPKFISQIHILVRDFANFLFCIPTLRLPDNLTIPIETAWDDFTVSREFGTALFKAFARIALALSRNTATIVLEQSQIQYIRNIKNNMRDGHRENDEHDEHESHIMTDGAGPISPSLADKIRLFFGHRYRPSAFQGRIGNAKGLWAVDYNDNSNRIWIKVSDSQRKWNDMQGNDAEADHPSHRTFEVLDYLRPLKPAKLSMQMLPIFESQATSADGLHRTLKKMIDLGVRGGISRLVEAFKEPLFLQRWAQRSNANTTDILRAGEVPYKGGMPISSEDQLRMLLDAGCTTDKNPFSKGVARKLLLNRLNDIKKKLSVPLARSTNVHIMADWWGVLEPGKVYLDFSSFMNDQTGNYEELLAGQEVLVARSPAHFPSDIRKVKVVPEAELMSHKDVIIFFAKGKEPLADMLPGGDYDGDKVFLCWEPSIVNGFTNANVPTKPKLAEEGWIRKDQRTCAELTKNYQDRAEAVLHFLKESFAFNMRKRKLGNCTLIKERLSYHSGTIDKTNEIY